MTEQPRTLLRPKSRPSTVVLVDVTPFIAAEWLENNNAMNRKISTDEVERYAADIEGNRWNDTADPIKFDAHEQMLDGQQRCAAIIKTGQTVTCHVVYDMPPTTRVNIDDGRKRRFADDLQMNSVANGAAIEALMRKILIWNDQQGLHITGGPKRVSRATLAEAYAGTGDTPGYAPQIREAIDIIHRHHRLPCSRPVAQFMAWLLRQHAPASVIDKYLTILSIGSLADEDQVLVRLKERLEANRLEAKLKIRRSYTAAEVYMMIRGWNAWLSGDKRASYNLPSGGLHPPFPLPLSVELETN